MSSRLRIQPEAGSPLGENIVLLGQPTESEKSAEPIRGRAQRSQAPRTLNGRLAIHGVEHPCLLRHRPNVGWVGPGTLMIDRHHGKMKPAGIPADLWAELKHEKLLEPNAPVPN